MADFAVIYRCFKSLYFLPENLLAYADATSRLTANSNSTSLVKEPVYTLLWFDGLDSRPRITRCICVS